VTRTLITGVSGFTGIHLAQYLLTKGEQVVGLDQTLAGLPPVVAQTVTLYSGDICSPVTLKQVLSETQPDVVYHLAGVAKSNEIERFYEINVLGTVALFEAVVESGVTPKILVTSSSAVYGRGLGRKPLTEQFKLRPITHYGISKVAQETVAYRYYLVHNLPVICTRAFNLIGPGQPPTLACSAFARQIALAEHTRQIDTIVTGDLGAQRDFTDVRDVARAYALAAQVGKPGLTYNVCSQRAVSIKHCLDMLLEMADVPLKTRIDPASLQASDVPFQVGSAARLFKHTGWQSEITLRQSLADLLDYWRQQVASQTLG
jgi:GDP-4-dehydro-6-deoxy-D-mannose reductase